MIFGVTEMVLMNTDEHCVIGILDYLEPVFYIGYFLLTDSCRRRIVDRIVITAGHHGLNAHCVKHEPELLGYLQIQRFLGRAVRRTRASVNAAVTRVNYNSVFAEAIASFIVTRRLPTVSVAKMIHRAEKSISFTLSCLGATIFIKSLRTY